MKHLISFVNTSRNAICGMLQPKTLMEYHKRMIKGEEKHLDGKEMAELAGLIVQKRFNAYVDNLQPQKNTNEL